MNTYGDIYLPIVKSTIFWWIRMAIFYLGIVKYTIFWWIRMAIFIYVLCYMYLRIVISMYICWILHTYGGLILSTVLSTYAWWYLLIYFYIYLRMVPTLRTQWTAPLWKAQVGFRLNMLHERSVCHRPKSSSACWSEQGQLFRASIHCMWSTSSAYHLTHFSCSHWGPWTFSKCFLINQPKGIAPLGNVLQMQKAWC